MIPRQWRLNIFNWLGAGYVSVERNDFDTISVASIKRPTVDIEGLTFNVMPAQGGTIVQLRKYDHVNDCHANSTHIIADGEDIAETIGKIVAMELWKQ
jgi:hypothetical protein